MNVSNLDCKLTNFSEVENTNLLKVKILVQHDGENKNGSKFSLDAIKKAEPTIKNVPILAYIKRDENGNALDFDEHNMITKIVEDGNGFKITTQYLEVPIGVIPSDTEIEYIEINNRNYLQVTGYVWKRYSNEAYDILNNADEKGMSMEIEVFDGAKDEEDGLYDIKDYQFLGVTCLGDDVEPGMYDTIIEKYSSSKKFKKQLEDIYKEIYSIRKEEDIVENNTNITVTENEDTVITTVEGEESNSTVAIKADEISIKVEDNQEENFALDTDNIRVMINSKLKDRTVETEDWWGDKYTTREFYLMTIIPDDKIAVVEDNLNYYNYYGIPYEIKGDDIELDFDAKVPYIQEWRAKKENEVIETVDKEDELKSTVLNKFDKKEQELKDLNSKIEVLEQFKAEKDKEMLTAEVEEVVADFSELSMEEVSDIKDKVLNNEMDMDTFKKELASLAYAKLKTTVKEYSNKQTQTIVPIVEKNEENGYEPYGGIFK